MNFGSVERVPFNDVFKSFEFGESLKLNGAVRYKTALSPTMEKSMTESSSAKINN
jgi:hypothetical protein